MLLVLFPGNCLYLVQLGNAKKTAIYLNLNKTVEAICAHNLTSKKEV